MHVVGPKDDIKILNRVYPKVVYYTASWCMPCKKISPVINELSAKYKTIKFYKVDIDDHSEHVERMGINSVPTFIFYKDILSEPIIVTGVNVKKITEMVEYLLL